MATSSLQEDNYVFGQSSNCLLFWFLYFPSLPFSMGAPVMVELEGETDPLKIAMKELKYIKRASDMIFT